MAATTNKRRKKVKSIEIGWCELVSLTGLGVANIHAKIDTGAATSSLHAVRIKPFLKDGENWASFDIPKSPNQPLHQCEAKVVAMRNIRSSNGTMQERYVIETEMQLGPQSWAAHITLANRQSMAFPMLVGRRALKQGFLVNSGKRWMLGKQETARS